MGVLTREKVRVVDAEIVPADKVVRRHPERPRPTEVWVTPFDEIFGTPAEATDEEAEPAIPVLEVGPISETVEISVEQEPVAVAEEDPVSAAFDEAFTDEHEPQKGFEPLEAQSLLTDDELEPEDPVAAAFDEAFTDDELDVEYDDAYEYEEEAYEEPVVDMSRCNIALWRGYRKASFYAQTFDSHGNPVALAESPEFKYRGNGTPDRTEAAAQAHEALLALLRGNGWEPVERDSTWFGVALERR